jgi:hypothetical protein
MATEQILSKIKKLLALADPTRGGAANEVEVAMAMASRLMAEHDVQAADLVLATDEVKVGPQQLHVAKRTYKWEKTLMTVMEHLCDVKAYYSQSVWRGLTITFLGTTTDTQVAVELYQVFRAQVHAGSLQFSLPEDRRGYGLGYVTALSRRARQLKASRQATVVTSTALVYVGKKEAAVMKAFTALGLKTGRSTRSHIGLRGYDQGQADGRRANLTHHRSLGGTR